MEINIKEITTAWFDSFFGSDKQKLLAKYRLDICIKCPSNSELFKDKKWSLYCKECGCPLSKKIYSNLRNSCPLGKWEEAAKKHESIFAKKLL
jgi:PHP family Zn ribbon phosphoesterase